MIMWIKSARSAANGNCVEADDSGDAYVLVRDSKDRDGPVLSYHKDYWRGGRAVQFRPVPSYKVPAGLVAARDVRRGTPATDCWFAVRRSAGTLYFDADEVRAWKQGVEERTFVPA
jgi:hypothetical protein